MNGDDGVQILWGVGALALVLSSLVARRVSLSTVVKSVIGWAAIVAIIVTIVVNRERIEALAERAGLTNQQVTGGTVRILQSPDGHFYADVRINGERVRMLVDSGATITALSEATAARAKVKMDSAFRVMLATANGNVSANRGRAETFAIGNLETRDLSVVVSPSFGETNVIGMNMLSRLSSWRVEGRTLILEVKAV